MKYKAVIFDLDGTLVSTAPEYRNTVVSDTLKHLNTLIPKSFIDRFWFSNTRDALIKKDLDVEPDIFWKTFRKYDVVDLRKQHVRAYHDAIDFVNTLKAKGVKIGLVTGAPPNIAELEIEFIGKEKFDAIVIAHADRGITPKPHPHGIEECLKRLRIRREEAVFVGDSTEDIIAARNAGVFDVLIARGDHEKPDIKSSMIVTTLYDLEPLLKL